MKTIVAITYTLLLTACASPPVTQSPSSGIQPDDVRIAGSINENSCTFIKQKTCTSKRRNGMAKCHNWHKIHAASAGANRAVLISSSSETGAYSGYNPANTGTTVMFAHNNVMLLADYYFCDVETKPLDEDINQQTHPNS